MLQSYRWAAPADWRPCQSCGGRAWKADRRGEHRGARSGGQGAAQVAGGLRDGCPWRGGVGDRVEQYEVMDGAGVADLGHGYACLGQLACVSFALVAEHVVLAVDDQGWGQAVQLVERGLQR